MAARVSIAVGLGERTLFRQAEIHIQLWIQRRDPFVVRRSQIGRLHRPRGDVLAQPGQRGGLLDKGVGQFVGHDSQFTVLVLPIRGL